MTGRRARAETVSHEAIMAKLVEADDMAVADRQEIRARLEAGNLRFAALEQAVQPLSDVITAMGGEEQFKKIAVDAARGLAALAWFGRAFAGLAKWVVAIAAGLAVIGAAAKFIFVEIWKVP